MCGIAGYVTRGSAARHDVVDAMLATLDHRGPDSSGAFVQGRGAIGQTRLAVIDLVTGDPPILDEGGRAAAVLNGEIYNFRTLRGELLARGHRLSSVGDTETIAHLARDLAPEDVARSLHGMFAFAVWNAEREQLVLGRDRVGKKPLYWWQGSDTIVFASEIKALLAHPDVPNRLDPDAIPAYLHFGYVPSPRTFFEGIRSVPPGHVLVVDRDLAVGVRPYWTPRVPGMDGIDQLDLSMDEAASEVRRLLHTAVSDRLVADVPLGAFLSGGIDSSAIVGLMAEQADHPVRTFTIGFNDQDGFDERPWARMVAERFGTEHTEFVVNPSSVDLVERLVWHHDQPFGDSSAVPTLLLSELTREHVTVALCGDGGDELFAGYERFAAGVLVDRAAKVPLPLRRALARTGTALLPAEGRLGRARRFGTMLGSGLPDAYREWVSFIPSDLVAKLVPGGSTWALDDYRRHWDRSAGAAPLDRLLLLNLETYLVDDLLPKVDRTSMATALEVRAPFLDHHLVEFALRLPPATKQRGFSLKRCLKAAVADLLPPELLDRPKRGFGVPLARWFRDDLASFAESRLAGPDARIGHHLEAAVVRRMLDEHRSRRADHGHALWTLLTLEVFLRKQGW